VLEPLKSYRDRLYTLNDTGIHGVKHLDLHSPKEMKHLLEVDYLTKTNYCMLAMSLPHSLYDVLSLFATINVLIRSCIRPFTTFNLLFVVKIRINYISYITFHLNNLTLLK